jgi:hypothetical protein
MPPALALADYRDLLDDILATAVDAAAWTDDIFDQALRNALEAYNDRFTYETEFTVTAAGRTQDLSSITALRDILALYYPWTDGAALDPRRRRHRVTADHTVYFEDCEPAAGDVILVRHTVQHAIKDLDSAAATTVPDRHATLLATYAASHACILRRRQLSENPAIPEHALGELTALAAQFQIAGAALLRTARVARNPSWSHIGL